MSDLICPRCGSNEFRQVDGGPDSYNDDIFYISDECVKCGLFLHGWTDKWLDGRDGEPWTPESNQDTRVKP